MRWEEETIMAAEKLPNEVIGEKLDSLPGWSFETDAISKTYTFADFTGSINFVNALAKAAETANHHPDIDIRYNKVKILLSTHDSGGVTNLDIELATTAEALK